MPAPDGAVPSVYACYRFTTKLRTYSDMLDGCLARVTSALAAENPAIGRNIAIDGSDMPAYANGQRFLSKNGPERERCSDPDASWGHRSAVATRKGGGFYGFKIDMAVCTATDLPLAWNVRTASEGKYPLTIRNSQETLCSHGKQPALAAENAALREALEEQWWENHAEHCAWEWPHPEGAPCHWPRPEVLDR